MPALVVWNPDKVNQVMEILILFIVYICVGFICSFGFAYVHMVPIPKKSNEEYMSGIVLGIIFVAWPLAVIFVTTYVIVGLIGLNILRMTTFIVELRGK